MVRGNKRSRFEALLNLSCGNNNRNCRGCLLDFLDVKTMFLKKVEFKGILMDMF